MDALLLIYNLILIVLYSCVILLAVLVYKRSRKKSYTYLITLFGVYILDALILYLADFVTSFSNFYQSYFIEVPTLKTIVYTVAFMCIIKLMEMVLDINMPVWIYILFVSVIVFLLFIPGMNHSLLKLWLYFIPTSIFGIILGIYGILLYRKIPADCSTTAQRYFNYALYVMIIFSLAIFVEDTISIMNYSSYKDLTQRNFSEDIMSILFSLLSLVYLFQQFETTVLPLSEEKELDLAVDFKEADKSHPVEPSVENFDVADDTSKFFLFCREYQLTSRERDIMSLLLKNMNNEEISENLKISIGTTKTHIHNIYTKLDVKKRRQLLEEYHNFNV